MKLELTGVALGYGDRTVVRNVDLTVPSGEVLAVLGTSGCGKSTLLRTLAGLHQARAGRVLADGVPVTGPDPERALVFQDDALLPWRNAHRNVELPLAIRGVPRAERRARSRYWLEKVGLADCATRLPRQLSGGMRQRVQLARTFASEPRAILMDEPFAALDAQTRTQMHELLLSVLDRCSATVVFVTHDVGEALRIGDRVAVLRPTGIRIVAEGRTADPSAQADLLAALAA
jgi:NitT/TauT family transport system ATP-binding protein